MRRPPPNRAARRRAARRGPRPTPPAGLRSRGAIAVAVLVALAAVLRELHRVL